jgi:D-serine deaminase-like pyridoxal phosphate-dependent protein
MKNDFCMPRRIENCISPGILIDVERVKSNIKQMLSTVQGESSRLRPHVKTHKMADVIRMQVNAGITKFKAATISEASMIAQNGGKDILLAYQPIGPNIALLSQLIQNHPNVSFATIVDHEDTVNQLASSMQNIGLILRVRIDVDCGMHRTGIPFGNKLNALRQQIENNDALEYEGLHVYDGHLHQPDAETRKCETEKIIQQVIDYDKEHTAGTVAGGGSPTFPFWAETTSWECSPGTTLFWDMGYSTAFPELPYEIAVALLTRVISKPGKNLFCIDCGYKAIASEMPLKNRLNVIGMDDARIVSHSEEHMVLESSRANELELGQPLLTFPRHVCPTMALHDTAAVIRGGEVSSERWTVTARNRLGI